GEFWVAGGHISWERFHGTGHRHRIELPTYPFDHRRYWIEEHRGGAAGSAAPAHAVQRLSRKPDWFHASAWRELSPRPAATASEGANDSWVILADGSEECRRFIDQLTAQ